MLNLLILLMMFISPIAFSHDLKTYPLDKNNQYTMDRLIDCRSMRSIDETKFIENYKQVLKSSEIYHFLLSLLSSTPSIYQASLATVGLNEIYQTQQKLDTLVQEQKKTNELLRTLLESRQ